MYNIKKKEEIPEPQAEEPANPLMRKKKTPEELAKEAEEMEQDDFTMIQGKLKEHITEKIRKFDTINCILSFKEYNLMNTLSYWR